jgi:hypothetical protein
MIAEAADSADAAEVDRLLCEAARLALPLSALEPTNTVEEKARVGAAPKHNPRFSYAPQDTVALQAMVDRLASQSIEPRGVGRFFLEAHRYLTSRLILRMNLGDDQRWQHALYAPAPPDVVTLARGILSEPLFEEPPVKRPFGAPHLTAFIEARLKQYGIRDWTVHARPNLSSTNTDSANRVITVRADAPYSLEEMKRLVVHEVDTHVLRAANGASQPYRIFAVGAVPSYLMTEEGLAVINEERMGYIDTERTRIFAARVLAANRAQTSSFSDVYGELRDYGFGHDEAFMTTKRVKRGLSDTSNPGGFIKDQAYLWGRLLVEDHIVSGGDLSRLYVGKVALEHLPFLHELGLRPARYIPLPYS